MPPIKTKYFETKRNVKRNNALLIQISFKWAGRA